MLIDSCRAIDKITVGFLISNTLYTSSHPSGEVMITGLGTVPEYYNCITPDAKEHVNAVSRCKNLVVLKNVVLLNIVVIRYCHGHVPCFCISAFM